MTATLSADVPQRDRRRDRPAIRIWLYGIALLIVAMVVVGGATRLTDSGLSITEWKPIHGVIPPFGAADWQEEFAKYQAIPEYQIINRGMSLSEFKRIYWWEWAHRFLGRFIGIAFFVPLVFFWATGRIERALAPKLVAVLALGGLQGAVGWWMVASGLTERTDVSQYRLAVHLTLASAILAYVLWLARGLSRAAAQPASASARAVAAVVLALVFIQIFLGALVAGLDAGLVANTWPSMNGTAIPSGLFFQDPAWRNIFENPVTVHFDHRLGAYGLFAVAILHAIQTRATPSAGSARLLVVAVTLQAVLGVATVLASVPLGLALAHQFGALVVLTIAVLHLRAMIPAAAPAPRSAAA